MSDDNECESCGEPTVGGSLYCFDCGQAVLVETTPPFYYQVYSNDEGLVSDMILVAVRFFDQSGHASDLHLTEESSALVRALEHLLIIHDVAISEIAESTFTVAPPMAAPALDELLAHQPGMFVKRQDMFDF